MLLSDFTAFLRKYAFLDYIIDVIVLGMAYWIKFSFGFNENFVPFINSDIDNPLATDTFTYWSVCIFTFGVGIFIISFFWLTTFFDAGVFRAVASYIFAIGIAMLGCTFLSKFVGRPRPDTIAACGGDGSYQSCAATLTEYGLAQQFSSFPCSEASEAMAAAVFMSLFITAISTSFNNLSAVVSALPIFGAFFIAASCIWDRKYHVDDVVAGLVIGALAGIITFKTYKKSLKDKRIERTPGAQTETSSLPMPKYN